MCSFLKNKTLVIASNYVITIFSYLFFPCIVFLSIKANLSFVFIGIIFTLYEIVDLLWSISKLRFIVIILLFTLLIKNFPNNYIFLTLIAFANYSNKNYKNDFLNTILFAKTIKIISILFIPFMCTNEFFVSVFIFLSLCIRICNISEKNEQFFPKNIINISIPILFVFFIHNLIYFIFMPSMFFLTDRRNIYSCCLLYFFSWLLFYARKLKIFKQFKINKLLLISFFFEAIILSIIPLKTNIYYFYLLLLLQGFFSGFTELIFFQKKSIENELFYKIFWKIGGILGCTISFLVGNGQTEFFISGVLSFLVFVFIFILDRKNYDFNEKCN